ncbi:hypothetical protein ACFSRY_19520 [Pontibacter locisalis]|uniref:DKNYY family protein n=1 Tax=Pontibacter locisalis TaxID=1719035 RepID=A0ABW5ISS6_9BACT
MLKKGLIFCLLLIGAITGCKENYVEPDPEALGLDYYPLAIGDYRIYNVTDIKFQFNKGDTTRFQMRERVDTTFSDQTNTLTYKIVRSVRPNGNSQWVDDSVLVVSKSNSMVVLTKNNTKYVKLVFPVKEGAVWAGDAYNDKLAAGWAGNNINGKIVYTYDGVGEPYQLNGESFANTVAVKQGDRVDNGAVLSDRKEVYAKGIGLIYRLYNRIDYCSSSDGCTFGEGYKLQGHERHEVLIAHGSR